MYFLLKFVTFLSSAEVDIARARAPLAFSCCDTTTGGYSTLTFYCFLFPVQSTLKLSGVPSNPHARSSRSNVAIASANDALSQGCAELLVMVLQQGMTANVSMNHSGSVVVPFTDKFF
jgi:hypothetical protein